MDVFSWIVLCIFALFGVLVLAYFYIESGKVAVECINDLKIPEKWKVPVRTLVFIFNPLVIAILIILGVLILLVYAIKAFIEFIYGMNGWMRSTCKEIKELITK